MPAWRMRRPSQLSKSAAEAWDRPPKDARASPVTATSPRFWRDPGEAFFVGVVPVSDEADFSGRGLAGGFALYLGRNAPSDQWLHLVAHEYMHRWISRRIGGFPQINSNLEAWLNEGFTEA